MDLKGLAEVETLPLVERISVASLKPGDVLVLECEGPVSNQTAHRMTELLEGVFPGHKAVVLADGAKLKVLAQVQKP